MPLQLTTPKSTGDLDLSALNNAYGEIKIIKQDIDVTNKVISLSIEYGNTVNDIWIQGILPPQEFKIRNMPAQYDLLEPPNEIVPAIAHYDILISQLPTDANISIYNNVAVALYQWLIDNGYFSGTIT